VRRGCQISHQSPQKVQQENTPVTWESAWIETKLTPEELDACGVRAGSRVVVGKHRKQPFRLKDYIASYS
jgi:putative aminopeptidase FrvX